jgi:hypothetical protein
MSRETRTYVIVYRAGKLTEGKVMVKFTLERAMKAQRGVGVYLYSFFNLDVRWGGWPTRSLRRFISGKEGWNLFYRRLGGSHS